MPKTSNGKNKPHMLARCVESPTLPTFSTTSLYISYKPVGRLHHSGETAHGPFLPDVVKRQLAQTVTRLGVYEVNPCRGRNGWNDGLTQDRGRSRPSPAQQLWLRRGRQHLRSPVFT